MKKILSLFLFSIFVLTLTSSAQQNIGIGTNTPNPSAILDKISTGKVVLITGEYKVIGL